MNLTLDEITTHRSRLRHEIMERECLLAAFNVVEKYAASGQAPDAIHLGSLVSGLLPSRTALELKEAARSAVPAPASLPPPAPAALPSEAPVERYLNPELKQQRFSGHGAQANLVRWAIKRMADDYSLRDIATLLEREGKALRSPEISVVLTRLKQRGEIEEVRRAAGPYPTLFRNPTPPEAEAIGPISEAAATR